MEPGYEVYEYSRRGMLAELREALQGGSKPDEYLAYDGSTALVMACRTGHGHVVKELLAARASAAIRTEDGSTVLSHAVSGGSLEAVQAVLGARVPVDEPNEDGVTPLMLAVHYGDKAIVNAVCDAGADLNKEADGWGTALDGAVGEMAELLERRGAVRSQNAVDQPLAAAAERFGYGCFDTGENPHSVPIKAPGPEMSGSSKSSSSRPSIGDCVRARGSPKGLLKQHQVGEVVDDDGSDCLPLKVKCGDGFDYYNCSDVEVCEPLVPLPPDSDKGTPEGTARFLKGKMCSQAKPSVVKDVGLSCSPVGYGCHRIDKTHSASLALAVQLGCNLIDVAPNYSDGEAEEVVGSVLRELMADKKVRRDELVIATKVGNVLGKQLEFATDVPNMTEVGPNLKHCISPEWIEQELTRSLERLQLKCVDCVLLHCPEVESKAEGVDMGEVYSRIAEAFEHLEKEVAKGRISMYGVSAAFMPLRPTDAEHLDLHSLMALLPEKHHFRVIQFPLNYAEAQVMWVGHTLRNADGTAVDKEKVLEAPDLLEAARSYGLTTWINRPLDGIYKESHGVLRFSSLDCDVRSFSELQLDNCDVLEEKLTSMCGLAEPPFQAGEGACGSLAEKTIKVLSSVEGVDCVLLGMRQPQYVLQTVPLVVGTPRVKPEAAYAAVRALHNTVTMWFATAIHEADHGTAKDWRLPVEQKGIAAMDSVSAGA
mmetsp:Transcript_31656/g.73923  ORF Transcript_31656/g.73923 Transcript_31656/m.73923 type:complete len:709 (+) Transcript_31656:77-2203(+)